MRTEAAAVAAGPVRRSPPVGCPEPEVQPGRILQPRAVPGIKVRYPSCY